MRIVKGDQVPLKRPVLFGDYLLFSEVVYLPIALLLLLWSRFLAKL